jgi:SAM-dependent methyltransferase
MPKQSFPGLDAAFLEYFDVTPENQRNMQKRYISYFEDCEIVVDLACGTGDFVEMLKESGIRAIGVDLDETCCAVARERGLQVVNLDVIDYLSRQESQSIDGIFSAHLVEHLQFEVVLRMFQESYRVLRPGGVIVIATPNVHSLFAHLDMFYLHFGHVTFYHPRLISFFMEYIGFVNPQIGENDVDTFPLLEPCRLEARARTDIELTSTGSSQVIHMLGGKTVLPKPEGWLAYLWWHIKIVLVKLLVKPYIDVLSGQLDALKSNMGIFQAKYQAMLNTIDRPFESFVVAEKPEDS